MTDLREFEIDQWVFALGSDHVFSTQIKRKRITYSLNGSFIEYEISEYNSNNWWRVSSLYETLEEAANALASRFIESYIIGAIWQA